MHIIENPKVGLEIQGIFRQRVFFLDPESERENGKKYRLSKNIART